MNYSKRINQRAVCAVLLLLVKAAIAIEPIDLSGTWQIQLDPHDMGQTKDGQGTVKLPGIITAQGFGEKPSMQTQWTGVGWRYPELFKEWQAPDNFKFPFFLQPPRHYVGAVWFQREITIPKTWKKQHAILHLERVHWQSTIWVDGAEKGQANSLGTPHVFNLGILPAGKHTLTLQIDNRLDAVNVGPLSHSVTDHTQGNWNGVVGRMEIYPQPAAHLTQLDVFPNPATGTAHLKIYTEGLSKNATLTLQGHLLNSKNSAFSTQSIPVTGKITEYDLAIPNAQLWDEFTPNIYQLTATLKSPAGKHHLTTTFGFRSITNQAGRLTLNDHPIFLRGTLECCIFPRLGHPPTDVNAWRRIIKICKAHGLNHIRFHSWCPPEAAFIAADELGFYYQVEVSSWANQSAQIGSGRPLDAWIEAESLRMLAAYGNHPSFLLMAYGNEPGGSNKTTWLTQWVVRRKQQDSRRIYTTAAGWPLVSENDFHSSPRPRIQGWGQGLRSLINAQPPTTDFDWSAFIKKYSNTPVVSHEIGEWCAYPNFDEIKKYTGYFKACNFEIFREIARRNGLLDQSHDFLIASGKLQTLAYKHDIEAALRTERFGGFQLLDLHDFPGQGTALVGVLDAFWDSKGYITPEEYHRFCGPIVPLARLKKMVFTTDETLEAELLLSHFAPRDFPQLRPTWTLKTVAGKIVAEGKLSARKVSAYGLRPLGTLRVPLQKISAPAHLQLTVGAENQPFSNAWDIFVYPSVLPKEPATPLITANLEQALSALAAGEKVLWMPPAKKIANDPNRPLQAGFSPIFWNSVWTRWSPPHTLGVLVDPQHPAFRQFPTDFHSNWQWWQIQQNAQPFILTPMRKLHPLVQVIDDWVTNRKLGLVFEARVGKGRLIACSADLSSNLESRPAARQLRSSLLHYMNSPDFKPTVSLKPAELQTLIKSRSALQKLGVTLTASSAEPGYPASAVIDNDPATLWHTEFNHKKTAPPHELTLHLPHPVSVAALIFTQRQDNNKNGQVKNIEILDSTGRSLAKSRLPKNATGFRVNLPPKTRLDTLIIRVQTSYAGFYAALAEVELIPAP